MSTLMIPFNHQPVLTSSLQGSVSGNTYTVPAGKYARISITARFGAKAAVTYVNNSGAGAITILHPKPDTGEADGSSVKASQKIVRFAVENDATATGSSYNTCVVSLPGNDSQIATCYFTIINTAGAAPGDISYFSESTDSSHQLPAYFKGTALAASRDIFNGENKAEPVQMPGGSSVTLRWNSSTSGTSTMKVKAYGTIVKEREFDTERIDIWLMEGDILTLTEADWDGSDAHAHIELYNEQA